MTSQELFKEIEDVLVCSGLYDKISNFLNEHKEMLAPTDLSPGYINSLRVSICLITNTDKQPTKPFISMDTGHNSADESTQYYNHDVRTIETSACDLVTGLLDRASPDVMEAVVNACKDNEYFNDKWYADMNIEDFCSAACIACPNIDDFCDAAGITWEEKTAWVKEYIKENL